MKDYTSELAKGILYFRHYQFVHFHIFDNSPIHLLSFSNTAIDIITHTSIPNPYSYYAAICLMVFLLCLFIIFWVLVPQQLVWGRCQATSSQGSTRHSFFLRGGSTPGGSQLHLWPLTALGLLGGGGEQLVPDSVPNVFLAILEGWACVQPWEWLDGVVEVCVALIKGNAEVELFRAHPTNNKILSNHIQSFTQETHTQEYFFPLC